MKPASSYPARLSIGFAAVLAVLAAPSPARAQELPAPEFDYPPSNTRYMVAIAGIASSAAWYGASVGLYYAWPNAPEAQRLWVPVAGPWMSLAHAGCGNETDCSDFTLGFRGTVTTLAGIGQLGGLFLLAQALLMNTGKNPAALPPAPVSAAPASSAIKVVPTPVAVGNGGLGFGVSGVF